MDRQYQLTFYGTYKHSNHTPVHDYSHKEAHERWPETADELELLEVGEKHVDADGDEWERTA